jgi:hypothetical protein
MGSDCWLAVEHGAAVSDLELPPVRHALGGDLWRGHHDHWAVGMLKHVVRDASQQQRLEAGQAS